VKPNLLLLNPPAARPTMRDYYCSSTSKAGYCWQPMDLICQSGYLDPAFDLHLLDCAVRPTSKDAALATIAALRPAVVYALVGTANNPDDFAFLESVSNSIGARIFVSGDVARFQPRELLGSYPFLEGVVLDFTAPDLAEYLNGRSAGPGLMLRDSEEAGRPRASGTFAYPLPRHELFVRQPYRMPFLGTPFASVLTNYGCPFRCRYCNSGEFGFAERGEENLWAELDHLRRSGVQDLFVKDFTFNAVPERATLLLTHWDQRAYDFRWIGYFRAERIDAQLAGLLRRTRCQMVQFGIETATEGVLEQVRPGAQPDRVREGVRHLRDAGVSCGAHFVIGLPGDDPEGWARTLAFARSLPLSYASFNAFTRRPGSQLAGRSLAGTTMRMDPTSGEVDGGPDAAAAAKWIRAANRRFYLRPAYLISLARAVRSPRVLLSLLAMGASTIRSMAGRHACAES
jgi:anaerobic magnesium-protoporphyrin IX monomethyl ester cyclase